MSEATLRDALLLKCKQAIEDLHSEIDKLNDDRKHKETVMAELESEKNTLVERLSQTERERSRVGEEVQKLRSRNQQLET